MVTTKAAAKVAAMATGLAMATSMLSFAPIAHAATTCTFSTDLTIGATGMSVTCLQTELIAGGFSIPAGATGYFGTQTRAAVASWQSSKNIAPAVGYFGPISRAAWGSAVATGGTSTVAGCAVGALFSATTGQACGTTTTTTTTGPLMGGSGSVDTYVLISSLNSEKVGEAENDVQVAGVEMEVNEGSDIEITAVKLVFVQGTANHDFEKYADDVSVWLDGKEVGRIAATKFNDDNTFTATISLSGAVIKAGAKGNLVAAISGISNLDSADATDDWTVDFRQVRFEDAVGATVSEDPDTGTRTFSFEDFATATNAIFSIVEDNAVTNDARTIEVDATADTDNVDVLSFTAEAKGDADLKIKNYAVSVTVTGAANTDDVLKNLTLWIDGVEIASATTVSSGGAVEDYLFADVDYTVKAGTKVKVVIKADFLSIADALDEGDTIAFAVNEDIDHITTRIKVVDESNDDLVDADLTGTVTSGAFELRSTGVQVTFVSASEVANVDDGASDDTGTFTIKVNVKAFGGTIYVSSTTQATTTSDANGTSILENLFRMDVGNSATTTSISDGTSFSTSGGGALTSSVGNIELTEDESTDITFTVARTNVGTDVDGLFRVFIKAIGWLDTDTYGAYNIYDFNLGDYKTNFLSLD